MKRSSLNNLLLTVLTISIGFLDLKAQYIQGTVVDLNNIPVTEVNVIDLSSGRHTHSNEQGFFVLGGLNYGDTLQLTHLTYQPQRIVYHNTDSMFTVVLYPKSISLEEVVVSPSLNSLSLITDLDLKTGPVNSSQDLLMQVPGLFIGQHAGGGKAEQIFLRGFDVDHGTDVNVSVDGMPVNMVSHAHGQGYTDLHFVIPELVDNLDFGKGPYYADQGNFNTAGYIDFRTKKRLTNSQIKLERGQYNSTRVLGMFSLMNHESKSAYLASEYILTDGPFESPQNFGRVNLTGRFTADLSDSENIDISGSYFNSTWDASGQIPVRAVEDGTISRFGAIDDTEGGNTSRTNILVNYHKFLDPQSDIKTTVFFSHYDFQLYSNFTFFLNDPVNGDQIEQVETRQLLGFRSEFNRSFAGRINGSWSTGISMRNDQSLGNGLFHTRNRSETLQQIQLGDIYETNLSVYTGATFNLGKWAINPLIRWDYFDFKYRDQLTADYTTQSQSKAVLSPKLNLSYSYSNSLQLYIKAGKGFHSNDTRVVVKQEGRSILPAAFGTDVGLFWKPIPRLFINIAYWYLYLEQEFIYVGDEGIVEPGGATRRQGIDSSIRYQLMDGLFWNFDANYAHARSIDAEKGQDYIPLAPGFTLLTGLRLIQNSGFYGGINLRYLVDRPANEDYSLVAQGYAVMDFNIGYQWKTFNLGLDIQNLLDTDWNEAQFGTESRLFNEQASVEEIHFTPGTPFFLKVVASFKF